MNGLPGGKWPLTQNAQDNDLLPDNSRIVRNSGTIDELLLPGESEKPVALKQSICGLTIVRARRLSCPLRKRPQAQYSEPIARDAPVAQSERASAF